MLRFCVSGPCRSRTHPSTVRPKKHLCYFTSTCYVSEFYISLARVIFGEETSGVLRTTLVYRFFSSFDRPGCEHFYVYFPCIEIGIGKRRVWAEQLFAMRSEWGLVSRRLVVSAVLDAVCFSRVAEGCIETCASVITSLYIFTSIILIIVWNK